MLTIEFVAILCQETERGGDLNMIMSPLTQIYSKATDYKINFFFSML